MLEHVTQRVPASTQVVAVSDRESDTIEYLHAAVDGGHRFLVRATHDRRLAQEEENRLWQAAADGDVLGVYAVTVPRADQRPERQAMLALQVVTVEVAAPAGKRALGSVTVTAILAREIGCPQNQAPLHWLAHRTSTWAKIRQDPFPQCCARRLASVPDFTRRARRWLNDRSFPRMTEL